MTSVTIYRKPVIFTGDSEGLLGTLLDAQIRQQVTAKNSYTGYGRELEPFDFEQQEDGILIKKQINSNNKKNKIKQSSWQSLEDEKTGKNFQSKGKQRRSKPPHNKKVRGKKVGGQNYNNSNNNYYKNKNNNQINGKNNQEGKSKGRQERGEKNGLEETKFSKNVNNSKRKNKKFSQSRYESAKAQELTLQNVTKLRGYVSDTGCSEVESYESESGGISFKSESSVSLFYRSGFDGLEYEDRVPDFEIMMPSTRYAVPL